MGGKKKKSEGKREEAADLCQIFQILNMLEREGKSREAVEASCWLFPSHTSL